MQRVVIHKPGGYKQLSLETGPDPSPGSHEVLIRVEAIGVNFADCITRMGLYASARHYVGYPMTPGFEVAGTVADTGDAVTDLPVGTRVLGVSLFGGYASALCLAREQVFTIPEDWTMAEAAGFPAVHLTAWFALFQLAHPRPGDSVLVHSAAGGVGQALVQLANIAGCRVTGVVGSSHKVDAVHALGATRVIDKATEPLWACAQEQEPEGYQVILDANGVATLKSSYRHLAPGGKLVVYGFHSMFRPGTGKPHWPKLIWDYLRTPRFNPLSMTRDNKNVLAFNLSFLFHRTDLLAEAMGQLFQFQQAGQLRPLQTTTYPLREVARAHRNLESGQTVGKLVLTVD